MEICTVGSVRGESVGLAMVDLNGHEARNGGRSQGTPTAHRPLFYSERWSSSRAPLLAPSPLRTGREGFPSSGSSTRKGPREKRGRGLIQNEAGLLDTGLLPIRAAVENSPAMCEAAPMAYAIVICFASCIGSSRVLELEHQQEVSSVSGEVILSPRGDATSICPITGQPSLAPISVTRIAIGAIRSEERRVG